MTDPIVPKQPPPRGCFGKLVGCSGLIGAVIAGLMLIGMFTDWNEERELDKAEQAQAEKTAELQEDLDAFSRSHAPEMRQALDSLVQLEALTQARLDELRRVLEGLGRVAETDPDFQNWQESLTKLHSDQEQLRNDIQDAFLAYRKYQLSPDSGLENSYQDLIQQGREAAEATRSRYTQLRSELEQQE